MQVAVWFDGSGTCGVRIGTGNRAEYFDRSWSAIEVEIDGAVHRFALTGGFWRQCPEFRDSGTTLVRDWLAKQFELPWPKGEPQRFQLVPLGGTRFRLER